MTSGTSVRRRRRKRRGVYSSMRLSVSERGFTTADTEAQLNAFNCDSVSAVVNRLRSRGFLQSEKLCSVARGLQSRARGGGRESYAEDRASARRALDGDVAGVLLHDAVRDREGEPSPAPHALRREERVVDARDVLGRDADAGVADFDVDGVALVGGGAERYAAAVGDGVARGQEQVREDLLKLARVALTARQFLRVVARYLDVGLPELRLKKLQGVFEHAVQVDFREVRDAARAREVQEVVDDAGRAVGLPPNLLKERVLRVCLGEHAEEHLRVGRDARERSVYLVRDAGRQKADGRQLLALLQLLFEADAARHVFEDDEDSARLVRARALQGRERDVEYARAPAS